MALLAQRWVTETLRSSHRVMDKPGRLAANVILWKVKRKENQGVVATLPGGQPQVQNWPPCLQDQEQGLTQGA